jgi:hypothetical protein
LAERPATDRRHGLSEAVLRAPADHPNVGSLLVKTFAKLFGLYSVDGKRPPSFDLVITANLVVFAPKLRSWSLYYGQDFSSVEGKSAVALSTIYRVDSMSDVGLLPTAVPVTEFSQIFERIFGDTDARIEGVAALVFIITKLLPDYANDSVVGNKMTRLF